MDIQHSADWRFLYKDLPENTPARLTPGTAAYSGAGSFSLDDFSRWVLADPFSGSAISLQGPNESRADEQYLAPTDYQVLRNRYYFGGQADLTDRPLEVAVNDQNELAFGPIPDKAYIVRGRYIRSPQILTVDADVPIMPAQYHEAIKWKALRLLGEYDEADTLVLQTAELNFRSYASAMRRDLLRRGGPYIDTEGGLGGSLGGRSFGVGAFGPAPTTGFGTPQ